MSAFGWNAQFATGIEVIDGQHHHLVDLLAALSDRLEHTAEVDAQALAAVYAELVDYSRYHFRTEEELMAEAAVDRRHVDVHEREHREFVQHVEGMLSRDGGGSAGAARLLDFLVHWLTYHILGSDHALARQVAAIRAGRSAADAYGESERGVDTATATLLASVRALFDALSERHRELTELAASLERRVADRTEALTAANARLKSLVRRVETMAMTDILTGLPNRRHAMDALTRAWAVAQRQRRPLACLLVDADAFKEVNDGHGHETGDVVLKALAGALRGAARASDEVCRLGGDEFLVLAPDTTLEGGVRLGERLRDTVARLRVPIGEGCWKGSISVGVAARGAGVEDAGALLRVADQGVYEAKRAGRNAVRPGFPGAAEPRRPPAAV